MKLKFSSNGGGLSAAVKLTGDELCESIRKQIQSRAVRVANELHNAELEVIRGQGHGRVYRIPNTKRYYTASAPGEVPAVRTGTFRRSWQPSSAMSGDVAVSRLETRYTVGKNNHVLGELLENGTKKMAPRPHQKKILEKAKPDAMRIYSEPYGNGG